MGHIIDYLVGIESYSSLSDEILLELYEKNKKSIQELGDGYNSSGYPEGLPNALEFFAQLSAVYFFNPEELQILLPECYNYIRDFYNNL